MATFDGVGALYDHLWLSHLQVCVLQCVLQCVLRYDHLWLSHLQVHSFQHIRHCAFEDTLQHALQHTLQYYCKVES